MSYQRNRCEMKRDIQRLERCNATIVLFLICCFIGDVSATKIGIKLCLDMCRRSAWCETGYYNTETLTCYTHPDETPKHGFIYAVHVNKSNTCGARSCTGSETCVQTRKKKWTCGQTGEVKESPKASRTKLTKRKPRRRRTKTKDGDDFLNEMKRVMRFMMEY